MHALVGPNGAGKTTLLRILAGLLAPSAGSATVAGLDPVARGAELRSRIGFVPSGDRSFYLRLSGLENLVFFARLYGLRRRAAVQRAHEVLAEVGLADAAGVRVGVYSHGMQKRLAVARALLTEPPLLLVDEATHDLDPEGARRVRELVAARAAAGTAVLWATQRLDELRGFADRVHVLDRGRMSFEGSVAELVAHVTPRSYLVRVRDGGRTGAALEAAVRDALAPAADVVAAGGLAPDEFAVSLADGVVLGDALSSLLAAHLQVLTCREERSGIEEAFLHVTTARDG